MVKVGQRLHDTRINKSLSLEQISAATKIRPRFLIAIERGEYEKLPSPAYAHGFIRNYASYLGLSQKEILALFRREFDHKKDIKVLPDSLAKNQSFSITHNHIQSSLITVAIILIALAGYLGFQYRSLFLPPNLAVYTPKQNSLAKSNIIVSGSTDPYATVVINNQSVALDTNGEFTKDLTLFPGKNSIIIKAKNRFGKETAIERKITVAN